MSHPLLWLAGLIALDKLNQQNRKIEECWQKLRHLEHDDAPDYTVPDENSADGCAGCAGLCFLLFLGLPLGCALIYGLFFTPVGLGILAISATLLFIVLAIQCCPVRKLQAMRSMFLAPLL